MELGSALLAIVLATVGLVGARADAPRQAHELLRDRHFQQGFNVLAPEHGKRVVTGTLGGEGDAIWDLAQWNSRGTILGAEGSWMADGSVVRYETPLKAVTFGASGTEAADVALAVFAAAEYENRPRERKDPWPHLLASQRFEAAPSLADMERLVFRAEVRLLKCVAPEGVEQDARTHAAQFLTFITVQNLNRESPGHGDFLWFGVPYYDNRREFPRAFMAPDRDHNKFIYTPDAEVYSDKSAHGGEWVTIDKDLRPLMVQGLEAAWERGHLTDSRELTDYRLGGISIGWEVPGVYDCEMQVRNLSLLSVPGDDVTREE